MEEHQGTQEAFRPDPRTDGRDELNLAEFPLCALADRLNPSQKTLVFEDRIWDSTRGEMIPRQLTITGSDAHGLPTALDDEVLLGLVQLSKRHQFAQRKVPFTRYQLLQLLGWRDEGRSYARLEQSLNRWTGVTLYYQNAWWNKAERCWVNEKLHVLDNVTLVKAPRRPAARPRKPAAAVSSFVWNDAVFRSFQAGNLKSLDFEFFKRLKSSIAKRLYRFLDKRFFRRPRCEFEVKELAWEHIGLARSYDTANLKRKLRTAIQELERRGFLQPRPDRERFWKVCAGEWRVVFEKARVPLPAPAETTARGAKSNPGVAPLIARGVTPLTAAELVKARPPERIQSQVEVFDWLMARKDPKVARNPAGFLVSSIKGEYAAPPDYLAAGEAQAQAERSVVRRQRQAERQQQQAAAMEAKEQERRRASEQFWQSLSGPERQCLEQEALRAAPRLQREIIARGGALATATRQTLFEAFAVKMLGNRN